MIPMLIWFIVIVLIALLACLAIKFLALRIVLALVLSLPILLSVGYCVLRRSPVTETTKTTFFNSTSVISQRGEARGNVHLNTIAAFRQAKANGADTIMMDVRMTKDGMLIVFLPSSVWNSENTTYVIDETHWVQLSKLNVYGGNNGTILTFDDAVAWCETNNMNMLWHIPEYSSDLLTYIRNKILQESLYGKVAVTTYNFLTALRLRCGDTSLLIGLMWKSTEYSMYNGTAVGTIYTSWYYSMMDTFTYWGVRSLLLPSFLGVDFLGTSVDDADRALIVESKTYGINTILYEVETTVQRNYFSRELGLPIIVDDLVALASSTTSNRTTNAAG